MKYEWRLSSKWITSIGWLFFLTVITFITLGMKSWAHCIVWHSIHCSMLLQMLCVFDNICVYSIHTAYHSRSIYTCREMFAYISTVIKGWAVFGEAYLEYMPPYFCIIVVCQIREELTQTVVVNEDLFTRVKCKCNKKRFVWQLL